MKLFKSRIKVIAISLALVVSLGFFGIGMAKATGTIDVIELFRPLNLLGVSLQAGQTAKLIVVDTDASSEDQSYTLPSTSGRNGEWYIVKTSGSSEEPHVDIYTASGDTFENESYTHFSLPGDKAFVSFIADEDNDTWWTVGNGYPLPSYD